VRTLAAAAAVAVALGAHGTRWHVIGSQSVSGITSIAVANGDTRRPVRFAVRVRATPNQRTAGNVIASCSTGYEVRSMTLNYSGRTPLLKTVAPPMADADRCNVVASASVTRGGRVTLQVLAR
jgi:hypothetical protein